MAEELRGRLEAWTVLFVGGFAGAHGILGFIIKGEILPYSFAIASVCLVLGSHLWGHK